MWKNNQLTPTQGMEVFEKDFKAAITKIDQKAIQILLKQMKM